jgi:hypothetical protein
MALVAQTIRALQDENAALRARCAEWERGAKQQAEQVTQLQRDLAAARSARDAADGEAARLMAAL